MWSSIDTDMLLMLGKYIRSGICCSIFWYREANNAYVKDYDWNKESTYLTYWDRNSLYECVMSQKLPEDGFEWIKDASKFNEYFIWN